MRNVSRGIGANLISGERRVTLTVLTFSFRFHGQVFTCAARNNRSGDIKFAIGSRRRPLAAPRLRTTSRHRRLNIPRYRRFCVNTVKHDCPRKNVFLLSPSVSIASRPRKRNARRKVESRGSDETRIEGGEGGGSDETVGWWWSEK